MTNTIQKISIFTVVLALVMAFGVQFAFAATDNATTNESYSPGLTKNGGAISPSRDDPAEALGAPDSTFVSLGYGGEIVLGFAQTMSGNLSLSVFETTGGSYPLETAEVSVSTSPTGPWTLVGTADNDSGGGDGKTTFAVADCFQYVQIVDTTDSGLHGATSDAFDVDALESTYDETCPEPEPEPEKCPCEHFDEVIVSDETNTVEENGDANAVALSFIHSAWTASIPGATWIWEEDPVNPILETRTFEKEFTVIGTVLSAQLDIASDNSYTVFIDGVEVAADPSENNFQLATQDSYDLTADITSGTHTISIEVVNHSGSNNPRSNPAGLLYKLEIESEKCRKGDVSIHNNNGAIVLNSVSASANTGGNNANGGDGSGGGDGGEVHGSDDNNTGGNGGAGGDGGDGGTVVTGNAGAIAGAVNIVNTNITRADGCGCGGDGDTTVRNRNHAFVGNHVDADADTGENDANGGDTGDCKCDGAGDGGDVDHSDDNNTGGNGGSAGDGGWGGLVVTGNAGSHAGALNVVNTNRTRIRR